MRRFLLVACAAAVSLPLSAVYASTASAAGAARARPDPTIVVRPGQSIQAAVNRARPGDTVLIRPGTYRQDVLIRTDGITLRGSGDFRGGTVLMPPARPSRNFCNKAFGPTGVCVLAKRVTGKGVVLRQVFNDTVTGLFVTGFGGNGVFGYGTSGMTVTRVTAVGNRAYGISRFNSTRTLFANDTATGSGEAGFYVGDSPNANTVVRNNRAMGNNLGVFIRHARGVTVTGNLVSGNCQGILVLDDGQRGGAGNVTIAGNTVLRNNRFCPKGGEQPINLQGGGVLLLGATHTLVTRNAVNDNVGRQLNSGGIVVVSARALFKGSNPNFDRIVRNSAFRNRPFDLRWDRTGVGVQFVANRCRTSSPPGLCH